MLIKQVKIYKIYKIYIVVSDKIILLSAGYFPAPNMQKMLSKYFDRIM